MVSPKARAGREGQARKVLEWRVLFLSNGEIGLADKIREGGGRIAGGMEVRVIDLRADAGAAMGIFEDTHGAADPARFSQDLKRAANTSFGLAGRAFVADVAKDLARYRDELAALRKAFTERVLPLGADGQVRRVADRFALVAAGGEMASVLGVTGWPEGAAMEAANRCLNDWMHERGGIGSSEVAEARRRVTEAIETYGASRFQKWHRNADRAVITPRFGFVKVEGDEHSEDVVHTFFFLPSALREILAGLDLSAVVSGLVDEGLIVHHNGKPNKTFHVPNAGEKHRLYEVSRGALGGADD